MLDDLPQVRHIEPTNRNDEVNDYRLSMNNTLNSYSNVVLSAHHSDSYIVNLLNNSNNSISSCSNGESYDNLQSRQVLSSGSITNPLAQRDQQRFEQTPHDHHHHQHHHQQQHCHKQQQLQNPLDSSYSNQLDLTSTYHQAATTSSILTDSNNSLSIQARKPITHPTATLMNMNGEGTQHGNNLAASVNCSDLNTNQYSSQATSKLLSPTSPSTMALNFSHNLLHQTGHHNQAILHHDPNTATNNDIKSHHPGSFDLNSGSLVQSASVGMSMWRNPLAFRHPGISDHNFLQTNETPNTFSSWTHGGQLNHQTTNTTHHILDSPHLIGYPQPHQRALTVSNQDLSISPIKNQPPCSEQATFMLNSMNHQASASQSSNSTHHQPQSTAAALAVATTASTTIHPLEDLNHHTRSQPLDQTVTYNLSISDNQFYTSRSENRSHSGTIKTASLVNDRPLHMNLGADLNNHQASYHNSEHDDLHHPTTSQQASSSSSTTNSKNIGTFRCPTCHEMFSLRNLYQNHLKTHSHEKGSKAKFSCELCGHSFSQKTSLNRHMKSHTGERPFPCDTCGKAFSEKERLKIHMRTHTGEKPFSCTVCGKSFSQKSTVKRHQTVHTGEKKFKCDCGKGFANRGNLIAHIKTRGANHSE